MNDLGLSVIATIRRQMVASTLLRYKGNIEVIFMQWDLQHALDIFAMEAICSCFHKYDIKLVHCVKFVHDDWQPGDVGRQLLLVGYRCL